MEFMKWIELIVSILAGLAASIPLVVKLIEFVKKAVKEKNWNVILGMVMNYMAIAEEKFETGAERKEWVLTMVTESAKTVDYDIDMKVISDLIDNLCSMSKKVNVGQ
jgi:hypothetical protein